MPWVNDQDTGAGAIVFDSVETVTAPYVTVTGYSWSVGEAQNPEQVFVGSLVTLKATIRNDGGVAGDCRAVFRDWGGVQVASGGVTLAPGVSQEVTSTLTPTEAKTWDIGVVGQHFEA